MNHKYYARCKNILLRPLCHEDIEPLRVWRNDKPATRFLRQIEFITPAMQEKWFQNYLGDKSIITFSIIETQELNKMVGSVSLYNISENFAEFGKIQIGDAQALGKGIGRIASLLSLCVGFKELDLFKIFSTVHQENIAAHTIYSRIGFTVIGQQKCNIGGYEDKLEITKEQLLKTNPNLKEDIEIYDKK